MTEELERRYQRLMRAYPAGYRADRGPEIVSTYLDGAPPDRRWPSGADVADILAAGLRERARLAGPTGLVEGARLAGVVALALAGALSLTYLPWELHRPDWWANGTFGPFTTVGAAAWLAWLAALAGAALLPGRWARWPVGAALLLTGATIVAPALTDLYRPPLIVLLPQLALGVVALITPPRRGPIARVAVLVPAAAVVLALASATWPTHWELEYGYVMLGDGLLPAVGATLFVAFALAGAGYLALRDARVLWAGVLLLPATGLLGVVPISQSSVLNPSGNGGLQWHRLVIASVLVAVVSVVVFAVAVGLSTLARRQRPAGTPCPTCGRPAL